MTTTDQPIAPAPATAADRDAALATLRTLLDGPLRQSDALAVLAERWQSDELAKFAAAARTIYADPSDDDIEIDDDPLFSDTDDGVWVSGWLWVSNTAAGIESEDD
jgi:hypothetical protein